MRSEKLTQEDIISENGSEYDPSNNQTYKDQPLSKKPTNDIAYHIALSKKGSSALNTCRGRFLGYWHDQSLAQANNKVLHFPKPSDIGAVKFKSEKHTTFLPISLIERYFSESDVSVTHTQSTPILLNIKSERFFIPMDYNLFEKITAKEIFGDLKHDNLNIIRDIKNKRNILVIVADTVQELRNQMKNTKGTAFHFFNTKYLAYFQNLEQAEKVIVVQFTNNINDSDGEFLKNTFSDNRNVLDSLICKQKIDFNFFKAAKVEDSYYLIDSNGSINPEAVIHITEDESSFSYSSEFNIKNTIIIPHSDHDWDIISTIYNRLTSLCSDLERFLMSSKTEKGVLDSPLKTEYSTLMLSKINIDN